MLAFQLHPRIHRKNLAKFVNELRSTCPQDHPDRDSGRQQSGEDLIRRKVKELCSLGMKIEIGRRGDDKSIVMHQKVENLRIVIAIDDREAGSEEIEAFLGSTLNGILTMPIIPTKKSHTRLATDIDHEIASEETWKSQKQDEDLIAKQEWSGAEEEEPEDQNTNGLIEYVGLPEDIDTEKDEDEQDENEDCFEGNDEDVCEENEDDLEME